MSADSFVERLSALGSPTDVDHARQWFRTDAEFVGARMGAVFALAKEYIDMPPDEINRLLDSPIHEARVGAASIMGKQAIRKRTPEQRKHELFELYLSRTDRINTWDLVDVSAHQVIGGYLRDKPRDVLYQLARSEKWWERRIAVMATLAFIRAGDVTDTFAIAEILVDDDHDLVGKAVGGLLREAGKKDESRLADFLNRHAATMPRVMLRRAIERLDKEQRRFYLDKK